MDVIEQIALTQKGAHQAYVRSAMLLNLDTAMEGGRVGDDTVTSKCGDDSIFLVIHHVFDVDVGC